MSGLRKKKIAVLASRFPYPLEKGDKLRMYHHLKVLSTDYEIHLIALCFQPPTEDQKEHVLPWVEAIHAFTIPPWKRLINAVFRVLTGVPVHVGLFYDPKVNRNIRALISEIDPVCIYCQLIRMSPYARHLDTPVILDFMDSFELNFRSLTNLYGGVMYLEYVLTRRWEKKMYNYFDGFTAISPRDVSALRGQGKISVVRNGLDHEYYHPDAGVMKKYDISFCGNLGYVHNFRAANFIMKHLAPRATQLSWIIAGARKPRLTKRKCPSNVTMSGWVDDLREVYWSSRIFIAPIFSGSGMQNKVLEAMGLGIPCVVTPFVNEAIGAEPGKEVLLADSSDEFLHQIENLLRSEVLRAEIATNGRNFVVSHFDWKGNTQPLIDLFNKEA